MPELNIGDKAKEYIFTMAGGCVGCIELEIAQNLDGQKIKVVSDAHGGPGFISKGATAPLDGREHQNDVCTVPDDRKHSDYTCLKCWMRKKDEN